MRETKKKKGDNNMYINYGNFQRAGLLPEISLLPNLLSFTQSFENIVSWVIYSLQSTPFLWENERSYKWWVGLMILQNCRRIKVSCSKSPDRYIGINTERFRDRERGMYAYLTVSVEHDLDVMWQRHQISLTLSAFSL